MVFHEFGILGDEISGFREVEAQRFQTMQGP